MAVAIRIKSREEVHCFNISCNISLNYFGLLCHLLDYKCTYCLNVNIMIMMRHYLATVTMTFNGYFKHMKCTLSTL